MTGPRWCLVLARVATCLAGCGRAEDRRAVSAVTEAFVRHVDGGNGAAACAQLTAGARDALEHDEGKPCAEAATELDIAASAIARAEVISTAAKVDLRDGASAFLELTPRGWRIAAAGCRPQPDDEPFECEVEA